MSAYQNEIKAVAALKEKNGSSWSAINPEYAARMRIQNRFKTGLDIAKYTAAIMRKDMAEYDADSSVYTQSLGCWHGFIGQQKLISIKKHLKTTNKRYLYLSGWMVAALRSDFGPLPDQSMHEKTAVSGLIEELYTFLRQADARELDLLFTGLDAARAAGDKAKEAELLAQIDNFETHVVPIIADIDAGFGNAEGDLPAGQEDDRAGACCIQIENQVSDEKQCGHQDGRVTVPHIDLAKINAVRYAFLELGVDDGVIVARTDSLGAGLTKQIAVTNEPGDLGDLYNSFLDCEEISPRPSWAARRRDQARRQAAASEAPGFQPVPVPQGHRRRSLRPGLHHSLQNGADLLWIETEKPHVGQIKAMGRSHPRSDSERQAGLQQQPVLQLDPELPPAGVRCVRRRRQGRSAYDRNKLMSVEYDDTELGQRSPTRRSAPSSAMARPTPASSTTRSPADLPHRRAVHRQPGQGLLRRQGMLAYVKGVQRQELAPGHRLRQAPEHGGLRHRRQP